MKKIPFTQSRRWRKFMGERDKALEKLLYRARLETDDVLRGTLSAAIQSISYRYAVSGNLILGAQSPIFLRQIDQQLDLIFQVAERDVIVVLKKFRSLTHLLSYSGAREAIAQATETNPTYTATGKHKQNDANAHGEDLSRRVHLVFSRLKRKIVDALEYSWVQEEDQNQAIARVIGVLPKRKQVIKPARVLKQQPLQEADKPGKRSFSSGVIDDDEWDEMLDWYDGTFIPKWRGTGDEWGEKIKTDDGDLMYAWEIEQEMTNDFVQGVVDGESAAAKDAGINEFQWIAIIDNKTDECCRLRDGLTTKEIEQYLDSGKLDRNTCDATVPPAHFNCRCRIAPVGDKELDDTSELDSKVQEFSEWIKNKEAQ